MNQPNVLFAFKNPKVDDPIACHSGMGVTASNTVLSLREQRIQADYRPVANGEYLWAKLAGEWSDITHVVLCAPYIDSVFLSRLVRNYPKVRFALVYHSNLGFLAVDRFAAQSLPAFMDLEAECPNFTVAANCAELAVGITEACGRTLTYLPNVYHLPHVTRRLRTPWIAPLPLHVGLFGAARVLKNWLTAATATMILERKAGVDVFLHVNTKRDEGAESMRASMDKLLGLNPRVHLVEVPWLSADDFRRYLYGMDLCLQPSFTETFNNVTADSCAAGVPSVVSDAIAWAPPEWMAKADSATGIANVAWQVLRDKKATVKGWKALDTHNQAAITAWQNWLR